MARGAGGEAAPGARPGPALPGLAEPTLAAAYDSGRSATGTPSRRRIELFRAQKRVHAGSLIISLFGDLLVPRGGRVWLGSLIHLLAPLGLNERLVRTTVFRLVREQWLRSEALGRRSDYLLTPAGQRRCADAARQIYAAHAPEWDRRWRLILVFGQLAQKERDALRRALFWRGFGAVGGECFVHPGADLAGTCDALIADGLAQLLGAVVPFLAADASLAGTASNADLVARAWDLRELAEAYADFVGAYAPLLAQLRGQGELAIDEVGEGGENDQDAFLIRLLLIHDYRRLLLRDPQLPGVLLPAGWPGQPARALCKELYRRLLTPSERHLDRLLSTADGRCPARHARFHSRFAVDDPLLLAAP